MIELSALITSSKAAYDIAKGLTSAYVDDKIKERTSELLSILLSVQTNALAVQAKHSELLKEKDDIAKKVMELEDWAQTKSNYELKEMGPGVSAYLRKKTDGAGDFSLWICPYCYNNKKDSPLQKEYHSDVAGYYFCPECQIIFTWGKIGRGFTPHDRNLRKR